MTTENPIWSERYRPLTVADCILPEKLMGELRDMVAGGSIPNLLLAGRPGVGKTTAAMAMLRDLGQDVYSINGSMKGNIDTLRTEIMDFASAVSFTGARKCVLIDEADYLNPQSTQPALRNFMEEFSGNCGFIMTCNYPNRIIEPLRSRMSLIEFGWTKADVAPMATAFFARVVAILEENGVEYQNAVIGELIKRHFPDWRRVLNELQRYSSSGKIDTGILARSGDADWKALLRSMREKDFTQVRKWVGENSDTDVQGFFRRFYDQASEHFTEDSVPQLVITIGEYQYKAAHVADQEVNMAAFLVHVMASCQFRP